MAVELTAVYQAVPEGFIAFVEELPGANTQGATLDEARANLREAAEADLDSAGREPRGRLSPGELPTYWRDRR